MHPQATAYEAAKEGLTWLSHHRNPGQGESRLEVMVSTLHAAPHTSAMGRLRVVGLCVHLCLLMKVPFCCTQTSL